MIVVDASVAVKWLVPEIGEAAAKSLLSGGGTLIAPAVIRMEVYAALSRLFREEKLTEEGVHLACGEFEQLTRDGLLQLIPNEDAWHLALTLSIKCKHPFADCLYLAMGKSMEAPVVTADEQMAKRGRKVHIKTQLLGHVAKSGALQ